MEQNVKIIKQYKILMIIAYLSMISFGLIENIKGAIVPSVRMEFGVDYTHIGQMLFVASLGYLCATFVGGMATEKFGLKKMFIFGAGLLNVAILLFSMTRNFYSVAAVYFLAGLALGSFEVGVNALGAQIFIRNTAMMMNFMHLFYGLGAAIAPKYTGTLLEIGYSWKTVYLFSSILTGILFIIILLAPFPQSEEVVQKEKLLFKDVISSTKVWLIAFTLGFCVIMELGIGTWLVNYLQVDRGLSVSSSTFYLTLFFILFTFARLVGGYLADKLGYIKVLLYFTVAATVLLFAGITLPVSFVFLFSIIGFFVSIMFPTIMVLIMKEFPNSVSTVMGFTITVCGIINMIGNWVIGKINDVWGLHIGLGAIGICGIGTCILLIVLSTQVNTCGMGKIENSKAV